MAESDLGIRFSMNNTGFERNMSGPVDVGFTCYYNGAFETENGIRKYVGGHVKTIDVQPRDLFGTLEEKLGLSLCDNRISYKLPYNDMDELKLLCEGGNNYRKMCLAAIWCRIIEIYLEHTNEDNVAREEIRVNEVMADFNDDEENRDYQPNSDDEDGANDRRHRRWIRGRGELKLKMLFGSIREFREAVLEYVLREGWNIKFTRWGSKISEARCANGGGCTWRVYCSFEKPEGMFMLKVYKDEHSCIKNGNCAMMSHSRIAKIFLNDIRKNPLYKPTYMQEQVELRFHLVVTYDQCRKARTKALDMIQEEHDEQFARLKDYKLEILE